jgi:hypothetical protein
MIEGAVKSRSRSRRSPTLRRETWRIARQFRLPIRGSMLRPRRGASRCLLSTFPGFIPYVERYRDTTKRRIAGPACRSVRSGSSLLVGSVVVARGLFACCARGLRGPTLAAGSALGETWLASRLWPILDSGAVPARRGRRAQPRRAAWPGPWAFLGRFSICFHALSHPRSAAAASVEGPRRGPPRSGRVRSTSLRSDVASAGSRSPSVTADGSTPGTT